MRHRPSSYEEEGGRDEEERQAAALTREVRSAGDHAATFFITQDARPILLFHQWVIKTGSENELAPLYVVYW